MKKKHIKIVKEERVIPAIVWGEKSNKVIIGVHGYFSNKEDRHMEILSEVANSMGYSLITFDLPEHGAREDKEFKCNPWNGKEDLEAVYTYACGIWDEISIFACSLGAYFSLLSYREMKLDKCLFLSPVVNMKKIIDNMMFYNGVDEERLEKEKFIPIENAPALEWEYYTYVKNNLIDNWDKKTYILHGSKDILSEVVEVRNFADKNLLTLEELESAEHFFHTDEELEYLKKWFKKIL